MTATDRQDQARETAQKIADLMRQRAAEIKAATAQPSAPRADASAALQRLLLQGKAKGQGAVKDAAH